MKINLKDTSDKFAEAHYFLEQLMLEYHNPQPFRWNLNAFLQALRNVTFFLQHDLNEFHGFRDWYEKLQESMKNDLLLRKFRDGRNIIVKQHNLNIKSTAHIGIYRNRKLKLAINLEIPNNIPSNQLLKTMTVKLDLIDKEHFAIGEEYGIKREWIAFELGEKNVLDLCDEAWIKIGKVLKEAHQFINVEWEIPTIHQHKSSVVNLLTETDIEPKLIKKWQWYD